MKIIIWTMCIIIGACMITFIPNLSPFLQTLIVAGEGGLATYLCAKLDKKHNKEEGDKNEDKK